MGEKKNDGDNNKNGGKGKKGNGEKKEDQPLTVVLKVELHCEGCASKICKYLRTLEGVENVKKEMEANKVTVVGAVDPVVLREKLNQKTKKKVDLISPQPKKDDNSGKKDQKPEKEKKPDADNKKKEPPATTAVLKLRLHCQGCIEKIQKTVAKTKGVQDMSMDQQKDLLTVKGTMDVKALTEVLKERLKRPVEIVPPKKEKGDEKEGGDNNNGGGGGGGGGGGKKKKKGNSAGEDGDNNGGGTVDKLEHMGQPDFGFGYPYEQGYFPVYPTYPPVYPTYPPVYPVHLHAPQLFSDENPNACSIM
ncbi:hypothetical protein SLA2020_374890 [Shorea laevis]